MAQRCQKAIHKSNLIKEGDIELRQFKDLIIIIHLFKHYLSVIILYISM